MQDSVTQSRVLYPQHRAHQGKVTDHRGPGLPGTDFGDKSSGFEAVPNNIRFVMPVRGLGRAGRGKLGGSPVSACCH